MSISHVCRRGDWHAFDCIISRNVILARQAGNREPYALFTTFALPGLTALPKSLRLLPHSTTKDSCDKANATEMRKANAQAGMTCAIRPLARQYFLWCMLTSYQVPVCT